MILPLENVESIEVSANSLDDSIEKTDVFVLEENRTDRRAEMIWKGLIKTSYKKRKWFCHSCCRWFMLVLFTALGLACLISVSSFLKSTQTRYYREQVKILCHKFFRKGLEKELEGMDNVIGGGDGQSLSKSIYMKNMYTFGGR